MEKMEEIIQDLKKLKKGEDNTQLPELMFQMQEYFIKETDHSVVLDDLKRLSTLQNHALTEVRCILPFLLDLVLGSSKSLSLQNCGDSCVSIWTLLHDLLLHDDSYVVIRQTMLAIINFFSTCLKQHIFESISDPLEKILLEIIEFCLTYLHMKDSQETDDVISLYFVKFLELVTHLSSSLDNTDISKRNIEVASKAFEGLRTACSAFTSGINTNAESTVGCLSHLLSSVVYGPCLITSMGLVGTIYQDYTSDAITFLMEIQETLIIHAPSLSKNQNSRNTHALKRALFSVLKSTFTSLSRWDECDHALRELEFDDVTLYSIRCAKERAEEALKTSAWPYFELHLHDESDSALLQLLAGFCALPSQFTTELIFCSMNNLPSLSSDDRNALPEIVENGSFVSPVLLQVFESLDQQTKLAQELAASSRILLPSSTAPPPIPVVHLTPARLAALFSFSLSRIIESSSSLDFSVTTATPLNKSIGAVIARLASSWRAGLNMDASSKATSEQLSLLESIRRHRSRHKHQLLDHVLQDINGRFELIISFLFCLFASSPSTSPTSSSESSIEDTDLTYDAASSKILAAIARAMPVDIRADGFEVASFHKRQARFFSILLCQLPQLPSNAFTQIQAICHSTDPELRSRGLVGLRNLILYRLNDRDIALESLLSMCADAQPALQGTAVRLVTEILYSMSSLHDHIESVARMKFRDVMMKVLEESSSNDLQKLDTNLDLASSEGQEKALEDKVIDDKQKTRDEEKKRLKAELAKYEEEALIREVQQSSALFFSLCSKNNELFAEVLSIYAEASASVKKAIHSPQIKLESLVNVLRESPSLLRILQESSSESDMLVLHVLHILCSDISKLSEEIMNCARTLFLTRHQDARFLLPVLGGLNRHEALSLIPRLLLLPSQQLKAALQNLAQISPAGNVSWVSQVITPPDILIELHSIDSSAQNVPIKKIVEAADFCIFKRDIFTQEVLAIVLQQLSARTPIPNIFMRTLIQALVAWPSLTIFIMDLLSRLVGQRLWEQPQLWEGFVRVCQNAIPHSFSVVISLPDTQFNLILEQSPSLYKALFDYSRKEPMHFRRTQLDTLSTIATLPDSSEKKRPLPSSFDDDLDDNEVHTEKKTRSETK